MNESIVVLAREGSAYSYMVISSCIKHNLSLNAVVVQEWGAKQKYRQIRFYAHKHGIMTVITTKILEILDRLLIARRVSKQTGSLENLLRQHNISYSYVSTLNGEDMQHQLRITQPDILLLAGVGIIKPPILEIPRRAIVNAHPGIVPKYRGNYVVRWALLKGDPVGITVHMVDSGIDTGTVLTIAPIDLPATRSLMMLEDEVEKYRAEIFAVTIRDFVDGKIHAQTPSSDKKHPAYTMMPLSEMLRLYYHLWTNQV